MAHNPATIALLGVGVGFAAVSCAFQPNSATPLVIQKRDPAGQVDRTGRIGSQAQGNESECVLTTGDIHLWCKWVTRYY